jgi:hypothetical protein
MRASPYFAHWHEGYRDYLACFGGRL